MKRRHVSDRLGRLIQMTGHAVVEGHQGLTALASAHDFRRRLAGATRDEPGAAGALTVSAAA